MPLRRAPVPLAYWEKDHPVGKMGAPLWSHSRLQPIGTNAASPAPRPRKLPRWPSVAKRRKPGSSTLFRGRVDDIANVPIKNSHMTVKATPEVSSVDACSGWCCKPMENCAAGPVKGRCAGTPLSTTSPAVAIEPLVPTAEALPAKTQARGSRCGEIIVEMRLQFRRRRVRAGRVP